MCVEIVTIFEPKVVTISTHNIIICTVCIKKRLVFEIQISRIVLNSSEKCNCLESLSEP